MSVTCSRVIRKPLVSSATILWHRPGLVSSSTIWGCAMGIFSAPRNFCRSEGAQLFMPMYSRATERAAPATCTGNGKTTGAPLGCDSVMFLGVCSVVYISPVAVTPSDAVKGSTDAVPAAKTGCCAGAVVVRGMVMVGRRALPSVSSRSRALPVVVRVWVATGAGATKAGWGVCCMIAAGSAAGSGAGAGRGAVFAASFTSTAGGAARGVKGVMPLEVASSAVGAATTGARSGTTGVMVGESLLSPADNRSLALPVAARVVSAVGAGTGWSGATGCAAAARPNPKNVSALRVEPARVNPRRGNQLLNMFQMRIILSPNLYSLF